MLLKLRNYLQTAFTGSDGVGSEDEREHALKVATAALLVEMSRADFDSSDEEMDEIARLIRDHFGLSDNETADLVAAADKEADRAVSLHDFTRLLHENLEAEEKHHIIEMLWQVGYADNRLDKYEDHFVRKVADLLYIPHKDLVRIKHKVKGKRR